MLTVRAKVGGAELKCQSVPGASFAVSLPKGLDSKCSEGAIPPKECYNDFV
jgi:hypothetical protein